MNPQQQKNIRRTVTTLVVTVGCMVGLAFASVPLYQLFCSVTGYGGTPNVDRTSAGNTIKSDRVYTVQFDANTTNRLPWEFKPVQRQVKLTIGEEKLAFYEAVNTSDKTITGTASFNVTPYKIAKYFSKVDCFCFTEQTLKPGEVASMPVTFYIDSDILEDDNVQEVKTITLSYTFYPSMKETADVEDKTESRDAKIKGS